MVKFMGRDQSVYRKERAVSEVIGSILLISVVVIGIAVIGVLLMSHPTPRNLPALSAVISEDTAQNTISIYHDGGDQVSHDEIQILVDGVPRDFDNGGSPSWSTWSMGQSLTYQYSGPAPGLVQIVYTGGSGATVLASSDFGFNPSGTLTTGPTGTATITPTGNTTTPTPTSSPTPGPTLIADFIGDPLSGTNPLTVQFTDNSTNAENWSWNFGDGSNLSTERNPSHTYDLIGLYTVSLTVTNTTIGSNTSIKTDYVNVSVSNFTSYVIQNSVFVYGTKLYLAGNNVYGDDATIVITSPLYSNTLNGGAFISVTYIYIDGDVTINTGSTSMGCESTPGNINITGNLYLNGGSRDIYGDVYVAKNLVLENDRIHGNMYINGDVDLEWGVPTLDSGKYIYYTGTLTHPASYDQAFLNRCIKVASVPDAAMPDLEMPSLKPDTWYQDQGYSTSTSSQMSNNLKIIADSFTSSDSWDTPGVSNIVIIARTGDITLTNFNMHYPVTGVLFAPNGKVTFNGASFEGVVLARDGFYVTSGGTSITFTNLATYFSDPNDYPF